MCEVIRGTDTTVSFSLANRKLSQTGLKYRLCIGWDVGLRGGGAASSMLAPVIDLGMDIRCDSDQ